jgi:hypothetical protein
VLYVLVVLAHDRRRVVHFNVTEHPTAAWTAQQMIEAFPEETAPRFLLGDRDQIYGEEFRGRVNRFRQKPSTSNSEKLHRLLPRFQDTFIFV